jgi:capsular polysaccharide biosynthesis protein
MEVGEAVQRILVQHWRLIAVLVLAGVCAGLVLGLRGPHLYAASARVSLSSTDPQDAAMSQALADSGRAVVTSPSHVARGLAAIGASRDVNVVAEQHVALQALGTSGVMELTVTDPDPYVAARLANALAQDLVATRRDMAHGATQSPAEQLANVQDEIARIDAQIAHVDAQLAAASPIDVPALAAVLSQLTSERAGLVQETLVLQGQQGPYATVIESAAPPTRPVPSQAPLLAALGGLLGLVLGIVFAAAIETVRPTVVGARAVARTVGAPLLGEVPSGGRSRSTALGRVWSRLAVVMRSAGVSAVEVFGPAPPAQLKAFAGELGSHGDSAKEDGAGVRVPTSANGGTGGNEARGVVLVAGRRVKLDDLLRMADLVTLNGKTLLGVVTVPNGRRPAGQPDANVEGGR